MRKKSVDLIDGFFHAVGFGLLASISLLWLVGFSWVIDVIVVAFLVSTFFYAKWRKRHAEEYAGADKRLVAGYQVVGCVWIFVGAYVAFKLAGG